MAGLADKRKSAGITQEQAATALNVTQGAVYQWETGKSKPAVDKLPALAKLYGCTVDDLLKDIVSEG